MNENVRLLFSPKQKARYPEIEELQLLGGTLGIFVGLCLKDRSFWLFPAAALVGFYVGRAVGVWRHAHARPAVGLSPILVSWGKRALFAACCGIVAYAGIRLARGDGFWLAPALAFFVSVGTASWPWRQSNRLFFAINVCAIVLTAITGTLRHWPSDALVSLLGSLVITYHFYSRLRYGRSFFDRPEQESPMA